jgi:antitoxin component of MazEF toxin-antitoxin module
MTKQKIIKTGHSLSVTIPAHFVQALGIKSGQEVETEVDLETGRIIYKFSGTKQLSFVSRFIKKEKKEKR